MANGPTPGTVHVILKDRPEPLVFENATFQFAQPALFVIETQGQLVGLFPLPSVQAVYFPGGPNKVTGVSL